MPSTGLLNCSDNILGSIRNCEILNSCAEISLPKLCQENKNYSFEYRTNLLSYIEETQYDSLSKSYTLSSSNKFNE